MTKARSIQPFTAPSPEAAADVRAVIEAYYEAWFDADPDRMAQVVHPQLAKRGWVPDARGERSVDSDTAETMVAFTGKGFGRRDAADPERRLKINVLEVYDDVATALVHTPRYIETLQLIRTGEGWRILNALWRTP